MTRMIDHWLFKQVDASSMALTRIVVGTALGWHLFKLYPAVGGLYPDGPQFQFPYELTPWMVPGTTLQMTVVMFATLIAAATVTIGALYRASILALFVGFTYLHFCDRTLWNNHFYFISLLLFAMCFCDADRVWSMRIQREDRPTPSTVSNWQLVMLKLLLSIVYFYGGITKLNPDWLFAFEPMERMVEEFVAKHPSYDLEWMLRPWCVFFFTYGGLLFDLAIPFLLWWNRTRWFGVLLMTMFHGTNHFMYTIGIFPPLMWAGSLALYCEPSTPRRVLRRITGRTNAEEHTPVLPAEPTSRARRSLITWVLGIVLLFQLIHPFRHFLYRDHVDWTYVAKAFSWRMMAFARDGHAEFYFVDHDRRMVTRILEPGLDPSKNIPRNIPPYRVYRDYGVLKNPLCQAEYAHYLRRELESQGITNFEIRVLSVGSMNGRPYQFIIDPELDLSNVEVPFWKTPEWIIPLDRAQEPGQYPPPEEVATVIERLIAPQREALLGLFDEDESSSSNID